ncbi:unnamed protein product [Urochloa humidicola]
MGGFSIDETFVQSPENRPRPTVTEGTGVPLIDLTPLTAGDGAAMKALVAKVGAACRDWGFFLVVGHGVPEETVARVMKTQRAFFALPADRKAAVRRTEAAPLGYYESEHTMNFRDWKEAFDVVPQVTPPPAADVGGEIVLENKWPEDLPEFREALEEYAKHMDELGFKLLELIARSLNLRPDRLHGFFKDQTPFIRLFRYPPCPRPDLALGVGPHTDAGGLTILLQDEVGGLDVRRRSDGEWVRVKPVPNSFIVNVGDIIQVWSNDIYESPQHRVSVNSTKERFSIPYFFNPAKYTVVEPLEELVSEENPCRYNPYKFGDFLRTRLNSNFQHDVENVLISDFKKNIVT